MGNAFKSHSGNDAEGDKRYQTLSLHHSKDYYCEVPVDANVKITCLEMV